MRSGCDMLERLLYEERTGCRIRIGRDKRKNTNRRIKRVTLCGGVTLFVEK